MPLLLPLYRFLSLNKLLVKVMLLIPKNFSPTEVFRDTRTVPLQNQNVLIVLLLDLKIIKGLPVHIKIKQGLAQQRHGATPKYLLCL